MSNDPKVGRQIAVAGMAYAPTNEQGVVALFGRLAPTLGFCIEHVQTHFPDCTARRRGKTCKIEFEYWAGSYNHRPDGANVIVCWENDWETVPRKYRHLEVISLKKYVGALPRVFAVGCIPDNAEGLDYACTEWNVPTTAQIGDLVMMYRVKVGEIRDLWKIVGPFKTYGKRNRDDRWPGLQAGLRCVTRLTKPVTFDALKRDPATHDLPIMRKRFVGKTDITDYWPLLYNTIVSLNPKAMQALDKYRFDR